MHPAVKHYIQERLAGKSAFRAALSAVYLENAGVWEQLMGRPSLRQDGVWVYPVDEARLNKIITALEAGEYYDNEPT